jgi:hypothetical protein
MLIGRIRNYRKPRWDLVSTRFAVFGVPLSLGVGVGDRQGTTPFHEGAADPRESKVIVCRPARNVKLLARDLELVLDNAVDFVPGVGEGLADGEAIEGCVVLYCDGLVDDGGFNRERLWTEAIEQLRDKRRTGRTVEVGDDNRRLPYGR